MHKKKNNFTCHIIGGGISGLFCAWYIKKINHNIKTVVYEASSKLGGKLCGVENTQENNKCLNTPIHLIRKSDRIVSSFIKKDEWKKLHCYINVREDEISNNKQTNREKELKCLYNTEYDKLSEKFKKKGLFDKFLSDKVWFSAKNLNYRFVNVLSAYVDEIKYNHVLKFIKFHQGNAQSLLFGKFSIDISPDDVVILAIDNKNCADILNIPKLQTNSMAVVNYQTSQTIFLPKGVSYLTLIDSISDRIFVDDNIITALIYDYDTTKINEHDLAIKVWLEIDKLRGVNSAFLPPHSVNIYKDATIAATEENNQKRPIDAKTKYLNVFIAGDWTMKDKKCSFETSAQSAIRAVKSALKQNAKFKNG